MSFLIRGTRSVFPASHETRSHRPGWPEQVLPHISRGPEGKRKAERGEERKRIRRVK